MMTRVTLRIKGAKTPSRQAERLNIVGNNDSIFINSCYVAVDFRERFFAIDSLRALDQLRGINHVRCATGMQHGFCVRQMLHQCSATTGMIQVHVCQEYVVDIADINILLLQAIKQKWH